MELSSVTESKAVLGAAQVDYGQMGLLPTQVPPEAPRHAGNKEGSRLQEGSDETEVRRRLGVDLRVWEQAGPGRRGPAWAKTMREEIAGLV